MEYKGYTYDYENDEIDPNEARKILHIVEYNGKSVRCDWTGREIMSEENFKRWIDLGCPSRASIPVKNNVSGALKEENLDYLENLTKNPGKAFHALNQNIIDALLKELSETRQSGHAGKYGSEDKAPVCFVNIDQPRVEMLHKQIKDIIR